MLPTTARSNGKTKKERLAQEIAKAVGAGRPVAIETVDFNDPNRPKTCLEVDFPILPINQISQIEANAGKPIYQMSKWWARRRSSVFRAMLLAGAMKAPEDPAQAAKLVWDVYYANHQKKGALKNLKVADIFMGGGATIVEGSRLGMQMYGCDLNPVAWFIVKNEMAKVDHAEVHALLAEIEAEVKPQIMPLYSCDCPRGHKGKWMQISTGEVMDSEFDPLTLGRDVRKDYRYEGPEVIYVFWAKHGPCQMTGCGHRTPIMSSPLAAVKSITVKAWEDFKCQSCSEVFDVEASEARMSPGSPLVVSDSEKPYAILQADTSVRCPHCGFTHKYPTLEGKGRNKKIDFALLVHRQWLVGSPGTRTDGRTFGGSVVDDAESTCAWYDERMKALRLLEVRGPLPKTVICPETGMSITTDEGTVPKKATFACGACGSPQDVLKTIARFEKSPPVAPYLIQGFCPKCSSQGRPYDGRFFASARLQQRQLNAAHREWECRSLTDLADYYPQEEVPPGLETRVRTPLDRYQYRRWKDFFNSRQMLALAQILAAISNRSNSTSKGLALAAFQQYLRLNNMFCIWDIQRDGLAPFLSKNNYQPPNRPVENSVFAELGRGNWRSCTEALLAAMGWSDVPWEQVVVEYLATLSKELATECGAAKSVKVFPGDPVLGTATVECRSSTDLGNLSPSSFDLVITDPPFGDIMQYSELSGFSYAWLKLALGSHIDSFKAAVPPTAVEAVANGHRHGKESDDFYAKVLTDCWRQAHAILKPSGLLAFTFHHYKDEPWIAVLDSLFKAGFYLEATFPVRSDDTKGEGGTPGTFGAQKVEYDIIHVCRKRATDPEPVSWARMRREVLREVRQIADILELHLKAGLPAGDLQVIKRGKALEYFSRHYGRVYVDEVKGFSVRDALIGINQLLDEESGAGKEPPPVNAEPFTRQFLRLFDAVTQQPRDQMQKLLRGTTIDPKEYEERGWCKETQKVYHLTSPLEIAQEWYGKHRRRLTSDYDQAMVLIGASFPASGVNVMETLSNTNFRPHPALGGC